MLALGLILILVSALLLVTALFGGVNDPVPFDLGLVSGETSVMVVFLIGAGTVLLFVMGLELTRSGVRRANRRRKEQKEYQRLSSRHAEGERKASDTKPSDEKSTDAAPSDTEPRTSPSDPE